MFTSMLPSDVACIKKSILGAICGDTHNLRKLRFLEIGVFGGDTARGVKQFCDENGVELEYWGVDNGSHPGFKDSGGTPVPPFEGANLVLGDSAEVFYKVPFNFDVVLIDGCHCFNHVVLDALHYGLRTRTGGFMLFHDTNLYIQHQMREQHGPNIPDFHNSVLQALSELQLHNRGWVLGYDTASNAKDTFGGMHAYLKLK